MNNVELTEYYNRAINNIISDVIATTIYNPKETKYLIRYRKLSKHAMLVRSGYEKQGKHIPVFLISSITHCCNLHCKGCYARENGICCEENPRQMLTAEEWKDIFNEASQLGIGFNILAGGEPLLRKDVLLEAIKFPEIIFPIFTNGTLIDDTYCALFDEYRNLVPVLSVEGHKEATDDRRGEGIYDILMSKMKMLKQKNILFGVSITVTKQNISEVTNLEFINNLKKLGCRVVFFIEYVPVDSSTRNLAFTDKERLDMEERQQILRERIPSVLFLSFPGDEKNLGGCIAAARGFFHINPYGDAEACPFSPYSDRNLKEYSLLDIIDSPFFKKLQIEHLVGGEHTGGCSLFENEEQVKKALNKA